MKKLVLCLTVFFIFLSINVFAQSGTGWTSAYSYIVISESNPRCVLTVLYNYRTNELGQREIFIYQKNLTSDHEAGCLDKYVNHENMYNDIIIAQIIFDERKFGYVHLNDCADNIFEESYVIYTSSCQTEEKTLSTTHGQFEYHFKACSMDGNCKALFQYCSRYSLFKNDFIRYCKKTIIDGASANCPEVIKDEETGTPWQCHPKDCFPFPNAYKDFNPIATTDDINKYDKEVQFYDGL